MDMPGPAIPQAGVIPFRVSAGGEVEILLIRRVEKKKWNIPKGMLGGKTAVEAAQHEAIEEAGAAGELSPQMIGTYAYEKHASAREVMVFLLRVIQTFDEYPEMAVRMRQWFPLEEAASMVKLPAVAGLIRSVPQYIRVGPSGRVAFVPIASRRP